MYWNHRVMEDEYGYLTIREVFYNDEDNTIFAWSAEPDAPGGDNLDELKWLMEKAFDAFDKPVLNEEEEIARLKSADQK